MRRARDLQCTAGCADRRFEVLGAPLFVGPDGSYLDHDDGAATFVCAACGSVALDLRVAAAEMRGAGVVGAAPTLTCPGCGVEMLPPEDDPLASVVECPACGERFGPEEGRRRLHRGGAGGDGSDQPL